MVTLICPHCGRAGKTNKAVASGSVIRCSGCQRKFAAGDAGRPTLAPPPMPPQIAKPDRLAEAVPWIDGGEDGPSLSASSLGEEAEGVSFKSVNLKCPACTRIATLLGKITDGDPVKCPLCGARFTAKPITHPSIQFKVNDNSKSSQKSNIHKAGGWSNRAGQPMYRDPVFLVPVTIASVLIVLFLGITLYRNHLKQSELRIEAEDATRIERAGLDRNDPEIAAKWLARAAAPFRDFAAQSSRIANANPLNSEWRDAYEKNKKTWDDSVKTLIGTEVMWPVVVENITIRDVQYKSAVQDVMDSNFVVKFRFEHEAMTLREHFDGKFLIGEGITLDFAKTLYPGSRLLVKGRIASIGSVTSGSSFAFESLYVHVADCVSIKPEQQKPR